MGSNGSQGGIKEYMRRRNDGELEQRLQDFEYIHVGGTQQTDRAVQWSQGLQSDPSLHLPPCQSVLKRDTHKILYGIEIN